MAAEVYANLTKGQDAAPASPARSQDQQFIEYASARRLERVEAQRELVDLVLRGPVDAGSDRPSATNSLFSTEMLRVLSQARDGHQRNSS